MPAVSPPLLIVPAAPRRCGTFDRGGAEKRPANQGIHQRWSRHRLQGVRFDHDALPWVEATTVDIGKRYTPGASAASVLEPPTRSRAAINAVEASRPRPRAGWVSSPPRTAAPRQPHGSRGAACPRGAGKVVHFNVALSSFPLGSRIRLELQQPLDDCIVVRLAPRSGAQDDCSPSSRRKRWFVCRDGACPFEREGRP